MSIQADAVLQRLARTWVRWWTFTLYTGLVLGFCASFGALAIFALADALWHFPQRALALLFAFWIGWTIALFAILIYRLLKSQRSLQATARRVELEFPELGSHLINLVQLTEEVGGDETFRRAAVDQAAASVDGFPFEQAAAREAHWQRFLLCMQTPRDFGQSLILLAAVLAGAYTVHLGVPAWGRSTDRLLHPWTFVPATGAVKIVKVTPGDTEILLGSRLEIVAEIEAHGPVRSLARLFVREDGGQETALPMQARNDGQTYIAAISQVVKPLEYRLEIGDTQTERFRVMVYEKPAVVGVDATYIYPAYLRRPRRTVSQPHADLEAPQFTRAELRIHASVPIARGHILLDTQRIDGRVLADGQTLSADLLLTDSTTYTIHLDRGSGHVDPEPRRNRVRIVPDRPPVIELVEPGRESRAAAGGKTAIVVRATDDYGLGLVRIEIQQPEGTLAPAEAITAASWTKFADVTNTALRHQIDWEPARFQPGQTIQVRAVARDLRQVDLPGHHLGPQEAATSWHQIHLQDRDAETTGELAQLEAWRTALAKLLDQQVQARVAAASIARRATGSASRRRAEAVHEQQAAVQRGAIALTESVAPVGDQDLVIAQRVVHGLAYGDMLTAVRQAESVVQVELPASMFDRVKTLNLIQDRIIAALRRLLNELRHDTADLLAQMKQRPDTAMPADLQSKLRELKEKLLELARNQKKVIEATENLAKAHVEDFSEAEKRALAELAAKEDAWSRFLADEHSDLSKLPEQDFANPSLLKELIAIETEIQMAKDALTKKAVDIAVPLEQLGAEMAQELATNIEKWLPDTPDRERWSQEEPLDDDMKEAPMAELPRELEDLVGNLMEDEEDLFDELEDVSSSAADSIDKGAGWDAADGPISNMSARGVTGNRLPNNSEISGRSGEGRQGRASGELVSDTAVGKGGRKTPSRLTPDPFLKGQVKDQSKQSAGGATGGGKESGQGGEGLQGPLPKRPEHPLGRLAAKQAELRNQAEGIDLRFQVLRYHSQALERMIEQMRDVEHDLRAGNVGSALRRRAVLLPERSRANRAAQRAIQLRKDQTANLPADIQREILGSMQEPSPAGWEERNRRYFERLSRTKPHENR